jgi:cardiolipin synthase
MTTPSDVASRTAVQKLADQAFARAAGALLVGGILLERRRLVVAQPLPGQSATSPHEGSGGRAAAGLLRVSNTVSAAISDHRELGPVEARIMIVVASLLLGLGVVAILFPRVLAYPLAAISLWIGAALLWRGHRLRHRGRTTAGADMNA